MSKKTNGKPKATTNRATTVKRICFAVPVHNGAGCEVRELYEDEAEFGLISNLVPVPGGAPSPLEIGRAPQVQMVPVPMWRVTVRDTTGRTPHAREMLLPIHLAWVEQPLRWVEHGEGDETRVQMLTVGQYEQQQRIAQIRCGMAAGAAEAATKSEADEVDEAGEIGGAA